MLDLNGDHKADLIWRSLEGRIAAWLMNEIADGEFGYDVSYCAVNKIGLFADLSIHLHNPRKP